MPTKSQQMRPELIDEGSSSDMSQEYLGLPLDELPQNLDTSASNRNSEWYSTRAAASINWALTYSSDEDSQNSQKRQLHRSSSDPSIIEESIPVQGRTPPRTGMNLETRRRSRSTDGQDGDESSSHSDDTDFEEERRRKSSYPKQDFLLRLRAIAFCTPVRWLSVLFVLTCYTTFWLPYPHIRPNETVEVQNLRPNIPSAAGLTAIPKNVAQAGSPSLLHARASPDVELTYRPGLDRFYEQEGFSNHSWTKYANVGALSGVLVWAMWEHRRRNESSVSTVSVTL